jgi:RHS repeat-associated protein
MLAMKVIYKEPTISFDNFLVQYQRGNLRQFNDYYPYGLSISGFNRDIDDYLYKYTGKELQTSELDPNTGTGIEMFDFHARFYDPQLGRWFTPDPAMQFSNPYLGISNNPANYIDPDGEFAMLFGIAGFTIGMMGTAIHADNNGIDMTGSELFLSGVRWGAITAGAYGIVSAAAAPAAAGTAAKSASSAKAAGVAKAGSNAALKAGLKGGTINMLSNYNYDNGFRDIGFGTFLDFSAGFLGAATGVKVDSKWIGMGIGGGLNLGFNAEQGDGFYDYAQKFAGGALSSYAGMGSYVKGEKLFSNAKWKNIEKFLKYGIQSTAYDFAYTEQKYFTSRTGWEHLGMFATGGVAGVADGMYFSGDGIKNKFARVGVGAFIYATEWTVTSRLKQGAYGRYNGYPPGGFYTGRSQTAKGWILGGKWLEQSWSIFKK